MKGQALIEYILILALVVTVVAVMGRGFRAIQNRVWMEITCLVAAPCPGCQPPREVQLRANQISPGACR
jgi:hypothetical protein